MEDLYNALWLKGPSSELIHEFSAQVPVPRSMREPGYRFELERARVGSFPLTGVSPQVEEERFEKSEARSRLPCGAETLFVHPEYIIIERLLESAVSGKWTITDSKAGFPLPEEHLDYVVSGQPGSGALTPWTCIHALFF